MHFLRYAALQPEPAVVLGDDDIFVQPLAMRAYAGTLAREPSGGRSGAMMRVEATNGTA